MLFLESGQISRETPNKNSPSTKSWVIHFSSLVSLLVFQTRLTGEPLWVLIWEPKRRVDKRGLMNELAGLTGWFNDE